VLRHGRAELLFFALPNGIGGKGSHTHNDKLSFVLRVGGEDVLCDSGTGCYTRDAETRNHFRRTAAHNTIMVDDTEQNRVASGRRGLFMLGNEAVVSPIRSDCGPRGASICASHSGYRSLGITHTRSIRVDAAHQAFVIEDDLDGHGIHDIEFNLQLAPNRSASVSTVENGIVCRIFGSRRGQLTVAGPAGLVASVLPSSVSATYGSTVPAMKVCIRGKVEFPTRITTQISWTEVCEERMSRTQIQQESRVDAAIAEGVHQV
jgi:hypothetical protein